MMCQNDRDNLCLAAIFWHTGIVQQRQSRLLWGTKWHINMTYFALLGKSIKLISIDCLHLIYICIVIVLWWWLSSALKHLQITALSFTFKVNCFHTNQSLYLDCHPLRSVLILPYWWVIENENLNQCSLIIE